MLYASQCSGSGDPVPSALFEGERFSLEYIPAKTMCSCVQVERIRDITMLS